MSNGNHDYKIYEKTISLQPLVDVKNRIRDAETLLKYITVKDHKRRAALNRETCFTKWIRR